MKGTWTDMLSNLSHRQKKWGLTALVLLVIYTVTGFFIIPAVARKVAADKLSQALARNVSIETVRFNPFTLTLNVENFSVKQKGPADDMVFFRSLFVNLKWSSLFRLAPVVSQVRLDTPVIHLSRDQQGNFNFSDLIPPKPEKPATEPEKPQEKSKPFRFSVSNIEIARGDISFRDDTKDKTHRVENMNLGVPFVSTIGQATRIFVMPNFSADINGKPFSLEGKTKPFHETLETSLSLELKEVDLPYYMEYVPAELPVRITSGAMTIGLTVAFMNTAGKSSELKLSGRMDLHDLAMADNGGRPLFTLKRLEIGLAPSRLLDGDVRLSAISLDAPAIHILRDAEGKLNLYGLKPEAAAETPAESQPAKDDSEKGSPLHVRLDAFRLTDAAVLLRDNPKPEAPSTADLEKDEILSLPLLEINNVTVDTKAQEISVGEIRTSGGNLRIDRLRDGTLNLQALAGPAPDKKTDASVEQPAAEKTPPWVISLEKLALETYQVRAANLLPKNPAGAVIDNIRVDATGLSTRPDTTARLDVACLINNSGQLALQGDLGLIPVSANLTASLERLGLAGIYPLIAAYFPGSITGGELSVKGDVSLLTKPDGGMNALFQGQTDITGFKVIDQKNPQPLIAFDALKLAGIRAGSSPVALKIDDVRLSRLDADLRVDAEGKLNLAREAKDEKKTNEAEPAEKANATTTEGEPVAIDIGRVALAEARLRFSDQSPGRPFQTELSDVNLEVTKLSSRPDQIAGILFSGLLDKQARLNISGDINPLAKDLYVDVALKFENMELSSLSPYSGKYIGRDIAKGKLFTDLGYSVKQRALNGKNHIFIDQLELGDKVDSPDATKLPVQLAIFLLQDREGKIVLDVPISGNLDDPQFSLGRTLLQVFTNLVTKAASSPFSLVSAALGGADPSHLDFAPGSADITENLDQTINSLSELLYNRPSLAVELAGFVDREEDSRALAEFLFTRKLKERKQAELPHSAAQSTPVDSITIAPEEYEEYLRQAYKLEKFSKPKGALGLDKKLPIAEMEALMRQHTQADETHLKMLAEQRSRQVRDHILASGKVDPGRVFVVETPYLKPETVENVSNRRVDVNLKQ